MSYVDELSRELHASWDPRSNVPSHPRPRSTTTSAPQPDAEERSARRRRSRTSSPRSSARTRRGARRSSPLRHWPSRVPSTRLRSFLRRSRGHRRRRSRPTLGAVALAAMIVAPQLAFVAGALAIVRALRRRGRAIPIRRADDPAPPHARRSRGRRRDDGRARALRLRVRTLARRLVDDGDVRVRERRRACCSSLPPSRPPVRRASGRSSPVPQAMSSTTSASRRGDPWRLAAAVALAVGAAVWLAGIVQGDPIDGLVRGIFEAAACLAGFAALGRYLGLRR